MNAIVSKQFRDTRTGEIVTQVPLTEIGYFEEVSASDPQPLQCGECGTEGGPDNRVSDAFRVCEDCEEEPEPTGHPDITEATYSAEDNKLRLYPSCRLEPELFQRVRDNGFIWAPKQGLFVAPSWSPSREDFCIEMAGEIHPEGTTLIERAAAKAERLDGYRSKRLEDSNTYSRAASYIGEQFASGQPILVGHHSERKARKDQERMEANKNKAVKMLETANYWSYRAEGVEHHANRANNPAVRARRIKKILADMRSYQRAVNFANRSLELWQKIAATEDEEIRDAMTKKYSGAYSPDGSTSPRNTWGDLDKGNITPAEALQISLEHCKKNAQSPYYHRRIKHALNRLGYERHELGQVPRFEGEITATILQTFAREQGADKPKARTIQLDRELWEVASPAPLPIHIANGKMHVLDADDWRDLMQGCGHLPKSKAEKLKGRAGVPILNFRAPNGHTIKRMYHRSGETEQIPQFDMTKEQYKKVGCGVQVSACGKYRFKVTMKRHCPEAMAATPDDRYGHGTIAVFITDSKEHPAPEGI